MRYLPIFLIIFSTTAYGNPYLDCYNGCLTGAMLGDGISALFGNSEEKETESDRDNRCRQQCIATVQSNNNQQSQYHNPVTCRPDGFGNFVCQ